MAVKLVKVKEQEDGMRLNRWFLKYYPDLPLSRLQKLLRTKQIKELIQLLVKQLL